jgi:hypothetical protein
MNDSEESWKKLVEAARKAPPEPEEAPPAGFASRVVALRDAIAAFARTLMWRRWSVLAALGCLVLFLAVLAATKCSAPARPLIEEPNSDLSGSIRP